MKSLIIGASRGLGRALAEELARRGHDLLLVASDKRDLEPLASDLRLRFQIRVTTQAVSLVSASGNEIRDAVTGNLQGADCIFWVAGVSYPKRDFELLTNDEINELIQVNFSSAVRILNALIPIILQSKQGNIVGVGTVAAVRARGLNTVYAASKRALEFFFEGLSHRLAGTTVRIQFYRVGYLDTAMTFGQNLLLPRAHPQTIAKEMIKNLGKDKTIAYLPGWWRWPMLLYSMVPRWLTKKLSKKIEKS